MTGAVTLLHDDPADVWWSCECGCTSFHMRGDGEAECTHCETIQERPEQGFWSRRTAYEGGAVDPEGPVLTDITGPVATDFMRRRFADMVRDGDFDFVIGITEDGGLKTQGAHPETRAQERWIKRKLRLAGKMLCGEPLT